MKSFSLEVDERTDEKREEARAMREHCQAKAKTPLDTDIEKDLGCTIALIQINPNFSE